jgi:hypothetical protein
MLPQSFGDLAVIIFYPSRFSKIIKRETSSRQGQDHSEGSGSFFFLSVIRRVTD